MGRTRLSDVELRRGEAFGRVASGSLSLSQACEMLGLSYRQGKQLWRRYRARGGAGLQHGLCGRASNRGCGAEFRSAVLSVSRRGTWTSVLRFRGHPFDRLCHLHGIEHRLTKPHHPWTNGQVERMNRTIKDATAKRYFYDTHNQLRAHLTDFLRAYNFARRLKTLPG